MTTNQLADFFRPPSAENARRVHIVSTIVAVVTALVLFILYRTLYSPEPIRLVDTAITVSQDPETGIIHVLETRKFEGTAEETIGVLRSVQSPYILQSPNTSGVPPAQVALEGGGFTSRLGEFTTHHAVDLPPNIYGLWCLSTSYYWWPSWSQREYSMTVPDVCFYGVHPNDGTR